MKTGNHGEDVAGGTHPVSQSTGLSSLSLHYQELILSQPDLKHSFLPFLGQVVLVFGILTGEGPRRKLGSDHDVFVSPC